MCTIYYNSLITSFTKYFCLLRHGDISTFTPHFFCTSKFNNFDLRNQNFKFDKFVRDALFPTQNEPKEPKRSQINPHFDHETAVHILLEDTAYRCFDFSHTNWAHLSPNRATHLKSPKNRTCQHQKIILYPLCKMGWGDCIFRGHGGPDSKTSPHSEICVSGDPRKYSKPGALWLQQIQGPVPVPALEIFDLYPLPPNIVRLVTCWVFFKKRLLPPQDPLELEE